MRFQTISNRVLRFIRQCLDWFRSREDIHVPAPPRVATAVVNLNAKDPGSPMEFELPGRGRATIAGWLVVAPLHNRMLPGIGLSLNGRRHDYSQYWPLDNTPEIAAEVVCEVEGVEEEVFLELAKQRITRHLRERLDTWLKNEVNGDLYRQAFPPLVALSAGALDFMTQQLRLHVATQFHLFHSNLGLRTVEELRLDDQVSVKVTRALHPNHFLFGATWQEPLLDFRLRSDEILFSRIMPAKSLERADVFDALAPLVRRGECEKAEFIKEWFARGLAGSPDQTEVEVYVCSSGPLFQSFPAALIPSRRVIHPTAPGEEWLWIRSATLLINCDSDLVKSVLLLKHDSIAARHIPPAVYTLAAWYALNSCSVEFHHSQWRDIRALLDSFRRIERELIEKEDALRKLQDQTSRIASLEYEKEGLKQAFERDTESLRNELNEQIVHLKSELSTAQKEVRFLRGAYGDPSTPTTAAGQGA
jgi:hypothetical protein